ncbi:class I SAM-dependent methyltransferase [Solibacillus sp. MA9]|uniref:Class I SAM-dependent methyltransferase n=1 Tax=Solibacillus palustris TaxID=2908203 RepID=A0ABS9UHV6_9BACL|nr:class I SAM-dependent methyltransferase [Solibacillus sp. MA9]MCH7323515.1 class I SAM-dependent methyltransferase [Solibacillus sp. MA9]
MDMKQNIYDNSEFFERYQQIRAREYNYNKQIEQPSFLQHVPDLQGLVTLDIGCGAGDFAAYCIQKGAKEVLGIDISANMITTAKKRHEQEYLKFMNIAFEDLILQQGHFHFISSSLALHYMANLHDVIQKISAALSRGGVLLFSIQHPIYTANMGEDNWITDEDGNILHFAVDRYHEEGIRKEDWLVDGVIMYHRSIATIFNTLMNNGLSIEKVVEPIPSGEILQHVPNFKKILRSPPFLIIRAQKI